MDFSGLALAGDFEEVYGHKSEPDEPQYGLWDAILTCFFIDTVSFSCRTHTGPDTHILVVVDSKAKNIVNYLRIIHNILAPGGVWINLGPLLWHWENNHTSDISIELDLEEVKALARTIGFEISVRISYVHYASFLMSLERTDNRDHIYK